MQDDAPGPEAAFWLTRNLENAVPLSPPLPRALFLAGIVVTAACGTQPAGRPAPQAPALALEHVLADSGSFNVLATIVMGPTEALLWDTQYHLEDARRLADRIAASGRRLTAIVISHADHDHYAGAATIVERFPGTPVFMTASALAEYRRSAARDFGQEKSRRPALLPDSIVTPRELPGGTLRIDGVPVEIIADVAGDAVGPTNAMLWIPSLRTLLASDVVFDGVYPWLGASDERVRSSWRESLRRIEALRPDSVVAGHKKMLDSPNHPANVAQMDRYLAEFDSIRVTVATPQELYRAMLARHPDRVVAVLLRQAAQAAFARRQP